MKIRIVKSKSAEYGDRCGLRIKFDVDGRSGSFAQNVYDDSNEVIYSIYSPDTGVYATWSTNPELSNAITMSEEFKEAFEKCFGIRIPDSK